MNKKVGVVIIVLILLFLNFETVSSIYESKNDENKEWTYMVFVGGDDLINPMVSADAYLNFLLNLPIPFNNKINVVCLYDSNSDENGTAYFWYLESIGLNRAKIKIIEE